MHAKRAKYWWCAQALLYPTGDVRRALADYYSPWRQNTKPEEWQDWPIRSFLHQDNHTKIGCAAGAATAHLRPAVHCVTGSA